MYKKTNFLFPMWCNQVSPKILAERGLGVLLFIQIDSYAYRI